MYTVSLVTIIYHISDDFVVGYASQVYENLQIVSKYTQTLDTADEGNYTCRLAGGETPTSSTFLHVLSMLFIKN